MTLICAVFLPSSVLLEGANDVIVFESDSSLTAASRIGRKVLVPADGSMLLGVRRLVSTDRQMWLNATTGECDVSPELYCVKCAV